MSTSHPLEKTLLKLFAAANDHELKASILKSKLATAARKSGAPHDAEQIDQALTALIDDGRITIRGAAKTGHHPRIRGTYLLTGSGKDHVKPTKPEASDETLSYQEAYILLQMIRFEDHTASRSKLNEKLKSVSARRNLEFPETDAKETIDYHLHNLVQDESLEEKRRGVSTIYILTEAGLKALGAADQHETVEFRFLGSALNFLLKVARDFSTKSIPKPADPPSEPRPTSPSETTSELGTQHIGNFITELKASKYASRDLIPIHEVRALVFHHHGPEAASHPIFDPLVKQLRSEGRIRLVAISNNQDATPAQLEEAIPGMNETLFYIVAK